MLVTNDDGVAAPGIDALVEALRTVKNTKVVVVAPDANQSGTGGNTTPGTLPTAAATTASGYEAPRCRASRPTPSPPPSTSSA